MTVHQLPVTGDPNTMTCHVCHGRPEAMCSRCQTVICGRVPHRCGCRVPLLVPLGSIDWDWEAKRRQIEWKGSLRVG